MRGAVLLTGATGFVGMEILARYLERTDRTVIAPVRARDEAEATSRLRDTAACLFGDEDAFADRLVALPADIEQPGLGLDQATRESVAEQVTDIVHSAASVSFTLPLDRSREINVEGTRRMLELAELCHRAGGPRPLLLHLDRVRGRDAQGRVRGGPAGRGSAVPQSLRAVEVRGRTARPCSGGPAPDPDLPSQHRRRGAHHRLDAGLQRALLAAEGIRARVTAGRAGASLRTRRRGARGLRRGRRVRAGG